MTHVHYRFFSRTNSVTAVFNHPVVTVKELKRHIMAKERLRFSNLLISNAQTNEEYTDEEGFIHRGTSVIIRRVPGSGVKSNDIEQPNNCTSGNVKTGSHQTNNVYTLIANKFLRQDVNNFKKEKSYTKSLKANSQSLSATATSKPAPPLPPPPLTSPPQKINASTHSQQISIPHHPRPVLLSDAYPASRIPSSEILRKSKPGHLKQHLNVAYKNRKCKDSKNKRKKHHVKHRQRSY